MSIKNNNSILHDLNFSGVTQQFEKLVKNLSTFTFPRFVGVLFLIKNRITRVQKKNLQLKNCNFEPFFPYKLCATEKRIYVNT